MKRIMVCLCVVIVFVFVFIQWACADELSELKVQMQAMQKQMQEMQEKIEKLEAQRQARIETPQEMEERVIAIEEKLKKPYEGGLLSLKGMRFEVGGELEFEYVDIEDDDGISNDSGTFQFDKFVLKPVVYLNDDVSLVGEIEVNHAGDASMARGYINVENLPLDSFFQIGSGDPFIDIDRKTETHTINATAFGYRDNPLGIFGGGKLVGPLYWRGSVTNGFQLASKSITDDSSYNIIHDDDDTDGDNNQNKDVGVGLGVEQELDGWGSVNVMGFGYFGSLSAEDISFLQAISGYGTTNDSDDDTKYRNGVNAEYKLDNFTLIAQYIHARDGRLDRDGWFIQPSYKVTLKDWKYLNAYELLFRYNELDTDLTQVFTDTLTWDRQTYTIGLITDIAKNIKLKTEYNINEEDTGDGDVNNNEFVTQVEYKF